MSTHQSPATESGVPGQPGLGELSDAERAEFTEQIERAVEMYDCRKRKATTSYSEDDDSPIRGARLSASFGWPIPGLNAASRRDQLWLILSPHQANTAGYRSAAWALPTSGPRLECVVQRKVFSPNDFHTLDEVESRLLDFLQYYEQIATPFEWKFTKDDLNALLQRIADYENTTLTPAA